MRTCTWVVNHVRQEACELQRVRFARKLKIATWNFVGLCSERKQKEIKALKCKTLGGIHIHHVLSHIEQQVPRTFHTHYRQAVCTAHARTSASLPRCRPSPVSRLFLACFTPVAPVASL